VGANSWDHRSSKTRAALAAKVLLRIVPKPIARSFDFIAPRDPRQGLNLTGKGVLSQQVVYNSGNERGSVFTPPSCAVTSPASFQRNASCVPQRSTYLVELKAVILPNLPATCCTSKAQCTEFWNGSRFYKFKMMLYHFSRVSPHVEWKSEELFIL